MPFALWRAPASNSEGRGDATRGKLGMLDPTVRSGTCHSGLRTRKFDLQGRSGHARAWNQALRPTWHEFQGETLHVI